MLCWNVSNATSLTVVVTEGVWEEMVLKVLGVIRSLKGIQRREKHPRQGEKNEGKALQVRRLSLGQYQVFLGGWFYELGKR